MTTGIQTGDSGEPGQSTGQDNRHRHRRSAFRVMFSRSTAEMPPGLARRQRVIRAVAWCAVAAVAIPCVLLASDAWGMIALPKAAGRALGVLWVFVLPILVVACLATAYWRTRVHVKEERLLNGRICPGCGYSLEGLPDEHTCPECGTPYTLRSLRDQWLR